MYTHLLLYAQLMWSGIPALLAIYGLTAHGKALGESKRTLYEVEAVKDIAYYDAEDADPVKHKLDLYYPKDRERYPVLLFVHGGAWTTGDKRYLLDVYGRLGRNFARQGIGTVVTNYRLSPKVQHPAHVEDVAKAFAWTRQHIAEYGGDPERIFVCGHSAGGHLAALLATDPTYLEKEKCSVKQIRGVIPMSGVFNLPPGRLFESVFTADPEKRAKAMPINHVKGDHPPFLVIYAERDYPTCDRTSKEFCEALKKCRCQVELVEIKERDHLTIIAAATNVDDPAARAILKFIEEHADKP